MLTHTHNSAVGDAYVYTKNGQLQFVTPKTFKTGGTVLAFITPFEQFQNWNIRLTLDTIRWIKCDTG